MAFHSTLSLSGTPVQTPQSLQVNNHQKSFEQLLLSGGSGKLPA